jgi:hypothetical protein
MNEGGTGSIFGAYALWHYTKGLKELFGVFGNILWFVRHFFSISLLLKTLFTPWKRMGENYTSGLDIGAFASTLIVNSLMRIVGFASRAVVIFVGVLSYIFVLVMEALVLMLWILAPAVLMGSLILAVTFFVL